jgi:hypothetical protein
MDFAMGLAYLIALWELLALTCGESLLELKHLYIKVNVGWR